jgi:sugar/nucleoside kinase (ribokinase family)
VPSPEGLTRPRFEPMTHVGQGTAAWQSADKESTVATTTGTLEAQLGASLEAMKANEARVKAEQLTARRAERIAAELAGKPAPKKAALKAARAAQAAGKPPAACRQPRSRPWRSPSASPRRSWPRRAACPRAW